MNRATAKIIPIRPLMAVAAVQPPQIVDPCKAMVSAAMTKWMNGEALSASERRMVDLVIDTNWAMQLGRLCIPSS